MINTETLERIIVHGHSETLVGEAQRLGKELRVNTTQIRSVFNAVLRIKSMWTPNATKDDVPQAYRELLMLKPKLAYQAGRNKQVEPLLSILPPAIDMVNTYQQFQNFVDFFEAILAYLVAEGKEE